VAVAWGLVVVVVSNWAVRIAKQLPHPPAMPWSGKLVLKRPRPIR
jgi:hypothetical protein